MVVVKGLVNSSKHPYSYFKHCKAFCLGVFFGIFDVCMERTWIRKSSLLRSQMETLATQATMVRGRNTHAVCCEENYFPKKNLNHLIVCNTRYTLFFQYVCFLL